MTNPARRAAAAGPVASWMRRTRETRESGSGLEIVTLPALAARLAGGFARSAWPDDQLPAITAALAERGSEGPGRIADMPGTPRVVTRTLGALLRADAAAPRTSARFRAKTSTSNRCGEQREVLLRA